MPKTVPISTEISNEMYRLHHEERWPFAQISRWLLETHQIKYSAMSVHRKIKGMLSPKLIDITSEVALSSLSSVELLQRIQRQSYQASEELLQRKNISGWRDALRLCIEATTVLHNKFNYNDEPEEEKPKRGVIIPKFVVAGEDPDKPN